MQAITADTVSTHITRDDRPNKLYRQPRQVGAERSDVVVDMCIAARR